MSRAKCAQLFGLLLALKINILPWRIDVSSRTYDKIASPDSNGTPVFLLTTIHS